MHKTTPEMLILSASPAFCLLFKRCRLQHSVCLLELDNY